MKRSKLPRTIFLLLLVALLLPWSARSQSKTTDKLTVTVTGEVLDSASGKGIEYATISITTDSMKVIQMAATDALGKFRMELKSTGKFKLIPSSMGYNSAILDLHADGKTPRIAMGKILLTPGDIKLKEVVVEAQKPLIKIDIDKLTYSIEADPESKTSTLVEMLRKVPQLAVDGDDNVTLNGQSNYKVLVNGKNSSLFSKNFKEVIRSLPANSVKDIEVITNPSSKYEAEGVGGIINIITNKKSTNGYSGNINLNTSTFGGYGANAYLSAKVGKFNFSGQVSYNKVPMPEGTSYSESENFVSEKYRKSQSKSINDYSYSAANVSLEASYDIDSLNLITLSLWGFSGNSKGVSTTTYKSWDANDSESRRYRNQSDESMKFGAISGSLDYQRLYKKPDKSLTVSYKLEANPTTNDNITQISETLDYTPYLQSSWNKANGSEHTLQVDYYNPITKKHNIEFGGKYILRINTSDADIKEFDNITEIWVPQPQRINTLNYDQHIASLYGGYHFKLKKFGVKLGLRAERTWNDGESKQFTGSTNFTNQLFNVVPYVTFSYNPKTNQSLKLSYTQRLQRPGIWHLNPYIDDVDPMNIRFGNPNLKSVISHSLSANYSIFSQSWNLFIALNSSISTNNINEITSINPNNVKSTTYANIGKCQQYGINGSYSYRLGSKFNIYLNANTNYVNIKDSQSGLQNDGFNYGGNLGVNVTTWKGGSVRAGGGAMSSTVTLQGESSLFYYNSIGLAQQLFKKKMTITANFISPFEKYMTNSTTINDPNFRHYNQFSNMTRQLSFSVGYRFGKMDTQVKKARRSINNDDKLSGGAGAGNVGK